MRRDAVHRLMMEDGARKQELGEFGGRTQRTGRRGDLERTASLEHDGDGDFYRNSTMAQ